MKLRALLALCVICGFLGTNRSVAQTAIQEKDTDESSDYSDLFGEAVKGMQALLANAIEIKSKESDSDKNKNKNKNSKEDKNDIVILQTLKREKHDKDNDDYDDDDYDDDDDDDDSLEDDCSEQLYDILNKVNSLFGGSPLKLETNGEDAVSEFWQNLRDLIGTFVDSNEIEENSKQPFETAAEVQQTDSQNSTENLNNIEQHQQNIEKATIAEIVKKDTNGNNVEIGQQENTETEISIEDNKQNDNNENTTSQKQTEIDENRLREEENVDENKTKK